MNIKYLQFFILFNILYVKNSVLSSQVHFYKKTRHVKKDIEALPVFLCQKTSDCPLYSSGCINIKPATETTKALNICKMSFVCSGEYKCRSFESENDNIYQLTDGNVEIGNSFINKYTYYQKDMDNKVRILHSCNSKLYSRGLCNTENCYNNSTLCFSGYCNKDVCIKKKTVQNTICRVNYSDIDDMRMECKLANQEPCTSNEQCDSNICHSSHICTNSRDIKPIKSIIIKDKIRTGSTFLFYFFLFLSIIIAVLYIISKFNSRYNTYKQL